MMFPLGIRLGIKHPYMKIRYDGSLILRNDCPSNIIFEQDDLEVNLFDKPGELKKEGNVYFQKGEYKKAMKYFENALELLQTI